MVLNDKREKGSQAKHGKGGGIGKNGDITDLLGNFGVNLN